MTVRTFTRRSRPRRARRGGEGLLRGARQRPGGLRQRRPVDGADRLDLARRRGQEGLLRAEELVERDGSLAARDELEDAAAGDRVQDVVVERRGDERRVVQGAEQGARRRLEHAAVRRDEQRLLAPALLGQARGEHVRRVRERLDAVEDPRRRVGHAGQRHGLGVARSGSTKPRRRPPRVTTRRSCARPGRRRRRAARASARTASTSSGEPQVARRALHPREVVVEGVGPAAVERARPRRRRRRAAVPRRSRGRSPPPPARGRRRRSRARRDSTRGGGRPGALPHLQVGLGAVGHVGDDLVAGELAEVLDVVGEEPVVGDAVGVDVVDAGAGALLVMTVPPSKVRNG